MGLPLLWLKKCIEHVLCLIFSGQKSDSHIYDMFFFSLKFQFWFSFIPLLKDSTFKLANLEINYDYKLFVIKSTIEMICALSAVLPAFLANEY